MKKVLFLCAMMICIGLLPKGILAEEAKKTWVDKLQMGGDFRYRHEFISSEKYNPAAQKAMRVYDRNRQRLRLRLGLQAQVSEQVDVFVRLATSTFSNGQGDPISTNQDLGSGSSPKPIWLERAYVEIRPVEHWSARAGRQPLPFEHTELVFDGDLNVEGIAALVRHKFGGHEVFARAGGFWAGERGPDGNTKHALTQGLFQGQLGGKIKLDNVSAQAAVSYIDFGNVKNNPAVFASNNGFGNTLTRISGRGSDTLGYLFDYNLIDVNGSVKVKLDKIEPAFVFDFVTNTAAEEDTNYNKTLSTGWMAGLNLKFKKLPLDWDMAYNYRVLQKDAVLGAYTDSDPAGGGTNFNGHKLSCGFNVMPGVRIAGTYFVNTKDPDNQVSEKHLAYDRVQGDLEVKF